MALSKVLARSPYFVEVTGALNDVIKLELHIWNDPDIIPTNPTKTLSKPIYTGTTASFNISPYLREYIDAQPSSSVSSNYPDAEYNLYCQCTIYIYINDVYDSVISNLYCFDGYSNFESGYNSNGGDYLLDQGTYYFYSGSAGDNGTVSFLTDSSGWTAKYIETGTLDETIIDLGNTGVKTIERTAYTTLGNTLEIYNVLDELQATYVFLPQDECKYTPVNIDFINRYGAPQREIMWKASYRNFESNSTPFKSMPSGVDYDTTKAIYQIMNVNGKESIRVNTGWVDESYSYIIQDMMLSEKLRAYNYPVKPKTTSIEMHKHINQKLINYTLEFEFAYDKLNNVI